MEFDIHTEGAIGTIMLTGDNLPSAQEVQVIYGAVQKIIDKSFGERPCLYIQEKKEGLEIELMGSSHSGEHNIMIRAISMLTDEIKNYSELSISMDTFIKRLRDRYIAKGIIPMDEPVKINLAG